MRTIAFTDGSCLGNPGPGGWSVIYQLIDDEIVIAEREIFGGSVNATNNAMELTAVHECMKNIRPSKLTIYTDSDYIVKNMAQLEYWSSHRWHKKDGFIVANVDLWKAINYQITRHDVQIKLIKGHADSPLNKRADSLARNAAQLVRQTMRTK